MIKKLYWKFEALILQFYTKFKSIRAPHKNHPFSEPLIVSLTSYAPRFPKLHLTLKTLLNQSMKSDSIILWISQEEFELLPKKVIELEKNFSSLKIKKCEDIRSYKKLIPTLRKYQHAYIATADDDTYYPRTWLERLVTNPYSKISIVAHRTHKIKLRDNQILPYETWDSHKSSEFSENLFPTGCNGVLYPPNCFSSDVLDEEKFLKLCPTADDLWFFWMAKLKGTKVVCCGSGLNFSAWPGTDKGGLAEQNVENRKNDYYIKNLVTQYGNPLI